MFPPNPPFNNLIFDMSPPQMALQSSPYDYPQAAVQADWLYATEFSPEAFNFALAQAETTAEQVCVYEHFNNVLGLQEMLRQGHLGDPKTDAEVEAAQAAQAQEVSNSSSSFVAVGDYYNQPIPYDPCIHPATGLAYYTVHQGNWDNTDISQEIGIEAQPSDLLHNDLSTLFQSDAGEPDAFAAALQYLDVTRKPSNSGGLRNWRRVMNRGLTKGGGLQHIPVIAWLPPYARVHSGRAHHPRDRASAQPPDIPWSTLSIPREDALANAGSQNEASPLSNHIENNDSIEYPNDATPFIPAPALGDDKREHENDVLWMAIKVIKYLMEHATVPKSMNTVDEWVATQGMVRPTPTAVAPTPSSSSGQFNWPSDTKEQKASRRAATDRVRNEVKQALTKKIVEIFGGEYSILEAFCLASDYLAHAKKTDTGKVDIKSAHWHGAYARLPEPKDFFPKDQ
ncbi:hypothetical protein ONZ45_g2528 [Pleurotus djamor]|nr:hypothetical protein ONZ45_g2528 [Pleurotus djamor]